MTKAKAKSRDQATAVVVEQGKDESDGSAMARTVMEPYVRHGLTASAFAGSMLGDAVEKPGIMDYAGFVKRESSKAEGGDLSNASRILAAQAITLDSMFTELARRAALNMGDYITAAEKYARLAMKAQSNCRATLESLARLHQPREQTVRHVHVNEGGQAIVAEQFHHHPGGQGNAKSDEQPHAIEGGRTSFSQPLRSENAQGEAVPLASNA